MKQLRSNVPRGSSRWAIRRAEWSIYGIREEDLDKPKIAIVNSSNDLAACFAHLDDIAAEVKKLIRAAGGLGFEVRTAAPSDMITNYGRRGAYILPTRDLIVNDIEVMVEGAMLDGMICLVSCDKTVPAQLMAAARLNIPTIVIACGYQPSGQYRGEHIDIEDVWLNGVRNETGSASYTAEELSEMGANAILGPGVCSGMGTANSMHIVSEALGMALPGTTPVLANSERMWDAVRRASERIVQMVWEDLKPRDILTPDAFSNAVKVALAVAGSMNTIKHLQALASEAEVDVDIYRLYERYADEIPILAGVKPNGDHFIEDFEAAGGTLAVMKQLENHLSTNALTVTGKTVADNLKSAVVINEEVIRPVDRPMAKGPSIVLVRGTLAPDTGIVKQTTKGDRLSSFTGKAIVFESIDEAMAAVRDGRVQPGHVVVLRGVGPKGAPGMGFTSSLAFSLAGANLGDKVAMITDGQQSGLSNIMLCVNEVQPEAAEGGPIGLVEDGDTITIDVDRRVVNLEVPEEVLAERRKRLLSKPYTGKGWLQIYQRLVRPLPESGGTLTK